MMHVLLPQQTTPFMGRESEIAQICELLGKPTCRLLTLLGLGGSGKTRLAVEVAEIMRGEFPDGVFFVPLQPLSSIKNLVSAIVDALPVQFIAATDLSQQLLQYLCQKHMLLVLDNFEHLLEGANLLLDIMRDAPQVSMLVTSREVLDVSGEWVRRIKGLSYPTADVLIKSQ